MATNRDEKDLIALAYKRAGERFADRLQEQAGDLIGAHGWPGSPIERIFWVWWECIRNSRYRSVSREYLYLDSQTETACGGHKYRIDFTLSECDYERESDYVKYAAGLGCEYPKIAIELDGHEFHERTKEQVIYRDKRDRDLQTAGYQVFHLSGSGLWRAPEKAVEDIYEACETKIIDWFLAIRRVELSKGDA